MTRHIDVYWSFRSPYSYLATGRLRSLLARWDVTLTPRIVRPLAIRDPEFFKRSNPRWIEYVVIDCEREAERLGVPFCWPRPDPVDQNLTTGCVALAQPLAIWLARLGIAGTDDQNAWAVLDAMSKLIWSGTPDWHLEAQLAPVLASAGADLSTLQLRVDRDAAALDAALLANEAAQAKAGHRGVPLMVFEGEAFFGQDRIDALEWRLSRSGVTRPTPVVPTSEPTATAPRKPISGWT